ncbi:MAG: PTS sugar transporter subunit IIA [Candidatus Muiribacteriota bacterium]
MARLIKYLKPEKIICVLSGKKEEILGELIDKTLYDKSEEIRETARDFLFNKFEIITMNLGNGFGITHGRMEGLDDINIGVSILKKPLKLGDKEPIRAIFCILVPPKKQRVYLSLLAQISRLFSHVESQCIFNCEKPHKIIEYVENFYAGK